MLRLKFPSSQLVRAIDRAMGWPTDCQNDRLEGSARPPRCFHGGWHLVLLAVLMLGGTGCVHRRITIQSDPPNALVLVDGHEMGYTPYSMDFTYYGTREVQLVKPGYETLTVLQEVPKPWYQVFPIEFFADNFWPCRETDRNHFSYRMRPKEIPPVEELHDRARSLRTQSELGR